MGYIGKVPADVLIDPHVDSAAITDGTIITADIANDAVTSAKLAANSVDSSELIDGSVDNSHLAGSIAINKTLLAGGTGLTLSTNTLNVDAAQTQITSVGTLTGLTVGAEHSYFQNTGGNANVYIKASNSGNSRLYFGDVADAGAGFIDYDHGTSMALGTEGTTAITIDSSQNTTFGGTASFSSGGADGGISLLATGGYNNVIAFGDSGDSDIGKIIYDHGADAMTFTTNTTERFRIPSDGNSIFTGAYFYLDAADNSAAKNLVFRKLDDTWMGQIEFPPSGTAQIVTRLNTALALGVNNSHKMTIGTSGRIAMGTTDTSQASLTVQRATNSTDDSVYPIILARNENDTGNSYAGFKAVGRIDSSNQVSLFLLSDGANSLGWVGTNTNNTFQVRTNGNVSVSFATNQVASGDFNDTSDIGYKENVATIKDGIGIVNQLNPVTFDWKNKDKGSSAGVIAQELEKILPELVYGENYDKSKPDIMGKAVSTSGLVGYLIKAVQELSAEVEKLKGN